MISGLEGDSPTIRPSVLVRTGRSVDLSTFNRVCHSFVTEGRIHFLDDSTHELRGQTVELGDAL